MRISSSAETGSGASLASYPKGLEDIPSKVIRLECEADHSLPSSFIFKKEWSYTSISPYIFTYGA
jgi:hypothetical protein